jgi:hypothetical protein
MITLLSVCGLAAEPTQAELLSKDGWTVDSTVTSKDVGDVEVFTKRIDAVPCFQARATAIVPQERFEEIVSDVKSHTAWSTNGLTESTLLGRSDGGFDYYQYLDVPNWTFASDRFWFVHGSLSHDATGAGLWTWKRLDQGGSYKEQYDKFLADHGSAIEPPVNIGAWWFKTDGSGTTDVRYYLCTDSGGALPAAIATAATRRTIPGTVADLIREAKKRALAAAR